MAMTGGTAHKVFSKNANYGSASWTTDLYVYVVQGAQSITDNTTKLTLGMYVQTPGSAYGINWTDFGGSYLGIGAFGGGAEALTSFKKNASGGGTMWLVENVSVTVKHNTDGSAKQVPIKWKWGANSPWGQYVTPSGTLYVDLTTIPRVSKVSDTTGTIGSALTINISRESSSFTHTLKYTLGSASGTIATKTTSTAVPWTPPMSLCNQVTGSSPGSCTVTCETYSGSTLIGTETCKVSLAVPSSVGLTLSSGWAKVIPYNTGTAADGTSAYVQGYSKAQVTFDSSEISTSNSYGATVKSYRVVYDGKDIASPYITATLKRSGTFTITCYVTDTRERTQSVKLTFTVLEYLSPTISNISCFRSDKDGNASDTGTYIYVKGTAVYSPVGGANSVTISARYKTSAGSYGSDTALTSGAGKVLGGGLILTTATYVVEIVVRDSFGGAMVYTGYVPSEEVFFHGRLGGDGAGLGKYGERSKGLDMAWDIYMNGNKIHDNSGFPRYVPLNMQKEAYRRSVIALCKTSAKSETAVSFSNGVLTLSRHNGHTAPTSLMVYMGDAYSLEHGVMVAMHGFTGSETSVRPCTFTYGGVTYGGLEYFLNDAQSDQCAFTVLDGNFDVFALDYYDTRGTVLNSEVYNSLNFTNYAASSKMISI